MQVYRELRVLTARPTPAEEALVPHRLYGVRAGGGGGQRRLVAGGGAGRDGGGAGGGAAADPLRRHRPLFPVADRGAVAQMPPVPAGGAGGGARRCWRRSARRRCMPGWPRRTRRRRLCCAPATASALARAWEVWPGRGRGWPPGSGRARIPARRRGASPPSCWTRRATALRAAIAARFDAMLAGGALEEVRALLRAGPRPRPAGDAGAWGAGTGGASARARCRWTAARERRC